MRNSDIVPRGELLKILKNVRPGLAIGKEILQQTGSFVFKDGNVTTFNDYVTVSCPINFNLEGAVPARELYNLLSKIEDKNIKYGVKDNSLKIRGKNFVASIALEEYEGFLTDNMPKPGKWKAVPFGFLEAVKTCLHSASKDVTESSLTCLHFGEEWVESCDNFRMTRYYLDGRGFKDAFLLPLSSCTELVNFTPIEYSIVDGWAHFKMEQGSVFSCRLAEGEFPELESIIDLKEFYTIKFPPKTYKILDRAEVMTDRDLTGDLEVGVKITKDSIAIKGEGKTGWHEETHTIKSSKMGEMEFMINSEFLKYILKHLKEATIAQDGSKLKFIGDTFVHIIALMK